MAGADLEDVYAGPAGRGCQGRQDGIDAGVDGNDVQSGSSGSIGKPSMAPRPYPNTSGSMHAILSMMPLPRQPN